MNLVPSYDFIDNKLKQGEAFTLNEFCLNKMNDKCKCFYKAIITNGFHECPYGLYSLATQYSLEQKYVYTSLRIQDLKTKKLKNMGFIKNNFFKDELIRLIGLIEQNEKVLLFEKQSKNEEIEIITSMFHELKKLSRDLETAGTIFKKYNNNSEPLSLNLIEDILKTINLIMIRINSYELLKNPEAITGASLIDMQIYKKFDKCRYILKQKAKDKDIYIEFENEAHFTIYGYEIIDILPYIILDNAVKYSPEHYNIKVIFDHAMKRVSTTNLGPLVEAEEIDLLCNRGFRGKNVSNFPGTGTGLNLLKQICDLHKIKINFEIGDNIEIYGKKYAYFTINLQF